MALTVLKRLLYGCHVDMDSHQNKIIIWVTRLVMMILTIKSLIIIMVVTIIIIMLTLIMIIIMTMSAEKKIVSVSKCWMLVIFLGLIILTFKKHSQHGDQFYHLSDVSVFQ